jgi:hypothetical protein
VDDARAGWDDPEVLERALRPSEQRVTLAVPLVLLLDVEFEGADGPVGVDLHRMVDDEVDGHERVDARGIAAEPGHRRAHRREVHHARDAREVLEQHTSRQERELGRVGGLRNPARQHPHVVLLERLVRLVAQRVLEQHLDRDRHLVQPERGHGRQRVEPVVGDGVAVGGAQLGARAERIGLDRQHFLEPLSAL